MSSFWPSAVICLAYVYLVVWGLPKYMENRKPMQLREIMLVYNFSMVILSGYTFLEVRISVSSKGIMKS
jgi:antibiotic biosynthesis monooxygenase (ABM) superfamily enzyme